MTCPTTSTPAWPAARLETMWDRLRALRQAVGGVRTPLKALYDSLSDERKARINALSDATVARRRGNVFEPQACAESASKSSAWPAKPTEEAVRPTDQQRASLGALASTTLRWFMSVVALFCGPAVVIGAGVAFITWSAQPFALRLEVSLWVKTGLAACYDFFSN